MEAGYYSAGTIQDISSATTTIMGTSYVISSGSASNNGGTSVYTYSGYQGWTQQDHTIYAKWSYTASADSYVSVSGNGSSNGNFRVTSCTGTKTSSGSYHLTSGQSISIQASSTGINTCNSGTATVSWLVMGYK